MAEPDRAAYLVSPTDRSGLVVISATLFMSWMVLVSLVRLYIRTTMNGPFGPDDLAALSASKLIEYGQALGVANVGVVMSSVSHGLGTLPEDPSESQVESAEKTLYAADILFLAGHCAAKMSVCLLLRRLGREKPYWKLCRAILVFISFCGVASVLAISLRCDLRRPWDLEQQCMHVDTRWKAITSFDVLTEALLLALSVFLVWSVKMRLKQKAAVIFAFAMRLGKLPACLHSKQTTNPPSVIVIAITRQVFINRAFDHAHILFSVVDAVICTEMLLHCSIMAATIPCLKPFVMAFNTGWGQGTKRNGGSYYDQSGTSGSHSTTRAPHWSAEEDERPMAAGCVDVDDALQIRETREWTVCSESIELEPVRK
ncbi:hypothetical protein PHISP_05512 [Aspergillus sp. HF37]|nr:hypothetical protein PHISP_05512 [Aspergillus sp. HF37]